MHAAGKNASLSIFSEKPYKQLMVSLKSDSLLVHNEVQIEMSLKKYL